MFDVRLSPPSLFYFLALVFFACGLMSKAMLVTLPFVLLLLDYWPLKRNAEGRRQKAELRMRMAEAGAVGTIPSRTLPWMKLV